MILKNAQNDTCLSDAEMDGWVEITDEELDAIRDSRSVQPDPQVILAVKKEQIRAVREPILLRLSDIAFVAQLTGDTETVSAYLLVRKGLLNITDSLPTDGTADAVVMQRYVALVAACTPQMVTAFAQVDA